jgi:hypothetical protein
MVFYFWFLIVSFIYIKKMGAISFIETMDVHSLSITQEEFDR